MKVDRLNVRQAPTVEAKVLGLVEEGDFLRIAGYGPFANDGYVWYFASFLAKAGEPPTSPTVDVRSSDGISGWIAVGKGGTSYVDALRPRCPDAVDLGNVQHLLGAELLACLGRNTIDLTGTFGCGECGGITPGRFEPGWLAYPLNFNLLTVYPVDLGTHALGPFTLHFPPDGPDAPSVGSVIRVRGHFDDPAASSCSMSVIDPLGPGDDPDDLVDIPVAAANLLCRQRFIVETVEILGIDPGFPA